MKNKKVVLIIIVVIACIAVVLLLGNSKKSSTTKTEEITIEFDSDGGSSVENIKIKKNSSISLPTTTKEGYNFIGWYLDSEMVNNETKFTTNAKLVAKWDKIPEDAKTFTIIFDTKGGSEINGLTLECDKEITLPPNPTKEKNTFLNWQDNNGNKISKGDILACEDITLTAVWKEDKEEESNSNSNSIEIVYTCPKGYTQKDKKCYNTVDAEKKCPDGTHEYNDACVKIASKSGVTPIRTCSTKSNIKGVVGLMDEEYYCFYGTVTDADEKNNNETCLSKGHKWNSSNKTCYYDSSSDSNDITYSCNSKNFIYISNPSQYGVSGIDAACFPIYDKISYCSLGTLDSGKCDIVLDATKTEKKD